MEQEDLLNKKKLRSLYFAKRISSTLIILSAAIILIGIFINVKLLNLPPSGLLLSREVYEHYIEHINNMKNLVLHSMIIPSAICIVILTPISIFLGRQLKIHIVVHVKKDFRPFLDLYKLKKTRYYRDLY